MGFICWGNQNKKVRGKLNFKKRKKISWIKVSIWVMPICILILSVITVIETTNREKVIQAGKAIVSNKIVNGTTSENEEKLLIVVNEANPLPKNYKVKLKSLEGFMFNEIMVQNLENLLKEARRQGYTVKITRGYTDADEQTRWYEETVSRIAAENPNFTNVQAILEADKCVGKADTDEHRTGLLVDFEGDDALYTWLLTNAPKYGFVQRYPKGKDVTSHRKFTPNVFRYVGSDFAEKMQMTGMCLNEYVRYLG